MVRTSQPSFLFYYWLLVLVTSSLSVRSLAIHPDKIRIATGQIAGVDKDGRVSTTFTSCLNFLECDGSVGRTRVLSLNKN